MGGFDPKQAKTLSHFSEHFTMATIFAVGYKTIYENSPNNCTKEKIKPGQGKI